MSHDDIADNQRRRAKRRKVEFQASLDNLEGRILLSTVRQLPPRMALISQQRALLNNRPNLQAQQGLRAAPFAQAQARAQALRAQLAAQAQARAQFGDPAQGGPRARLAAMNAMRGRRPMINFQPSINVNPTINVNGGTVNPTINVPVNQSTANPPTQPITPPPAQTTPPANTTPTPTPTPSTNGQGQKYDHTWPANVAKPKPTPKPTPPESKPTPEAQKPTTPEPPKPNKPETNKPNKPEGNTKPQENNKPNKPEENTKPQENTKPEETRAANPAPTFADGTILRNEQTGELGWYSNGNRRLISPPVAAKMGLTEGQTTTIRDDAFKSIPRGNDYFPEGMFVRHEKTGEISRYSDGAFHVVSTPVATRLGLGADDVTTIGADQYGRTNKGNDYFPEDILIQNQQSNEIAIYQNGQRRRISVPVASKMGLTPDMLTVIELKQFNAIAQGQDYFPNGVYLHNQATNEVALLEGGKLRLVSTPVASMMGLTSADMIAVTASQYNAIDKGADYFVEGMFIKHSETGEINQYSGGQRHWVSSPVAAQINLTPAQITIISAEQFNAVPRGDDYVPPAPEALAPIPGEQA